MVIEHSFQWIDKFEIKSNAGAGKMCLRQAILQVQDSHLPKSDRLEQLLMFTALT
jgi:hypothetical protein